MSYDIQKSHWISVRGKVRRIKNKKAVTEFPIRVRTMAPSLQLGFSRDLFLNFTGSVNTTAVTPLSKSAQMGPACKRSVFWALARPLGDGPLQWTLGLTVSCQRLRVVVHDGQLLRPQRP